MGCQRKELVGITPAGASPFRIFLPQTARLRGLARAMFSDNPFTDRIELRRAQPQDGFAFRPDLENVGGAASHRVPMIQIEPAPALVCQSPACLSCHRRGGTATPTWPALNLLTVKRVSVPSRRTKGEYGTLCDGRFRELSALHSTATCSYNAVHEGRTDGATRKTQNQDFRHDAESFT